MIGEMRSRMEAVKTKMEIITIEKDKLSKNNEEFHKLLE